MQPISPLVAGDFLAPVQRMRQKFQIYVDGFWVDLTGYAPVPIPEPPAYNFDLVIQDMAHAHTIENVVWSGEYIYAESCEYDDVAAAIALASPGDIVVVPAGYATWTYRLVITKGILLIAAGIGATVITCGFTATEDYFSSGHYLVTYQPITPADDEPFRLSGFTLNCDGKCLPILLKNTTTSPLTKVRIDHNRAYNKLLLNGKTGHDLFVYGTVYGVADNNEMDYYRLYGLDAQSWNNLTFTPGGADNFYIEDGTITQHSDHVITYGEAGGRYCLRHSDIAITGGEDL